MAEYNTVSELRNIGPRALSSHSRANSIARSMAGAKCIALQVFRALPLIQPGFRRRAPLLCSRTARRQASPLDGEVRRPHHAGPTIRGQPLMSSPTLPEFRYEFGVRLDRGDLAAAAQGEAGCRAGGPADRTGLPPVSHAGR